MNRRFTSIAALVSALVLGVSGAPTAVRAVEFEAPTWYVAHADTEYAAGSPCDSPDFTTDGDWSEGGSGDGAYDSDDDAIQDAVDNADDGDVIFVCEGIYVFDAQVVVAEHESLTFKGEGEEETILDGDSTTRILNADPHGEDDGGEILTLVDLAIRNTEVGEFDNGGAVIADGLVLERVTVSLSRGAYNGGALYAEGDVSISDSTFFDNQSSQDGAALYAWDELGAERSVTIVDSVFEANDAGNNGGALHLAGDGSIDAAEFIGNSAFDSGGAIAVEGDLEIADSLFDENLAQNEGGGAVWANGDGASVVIDGSEFTGNTSWAFGGALATKDLDTLTIGGTRFSSNRSSGGFGGAIRLDAIESVEIDSSAFVSNEALGDDVGGIGNGGAIDGCNVAAITVDSTRFIQNISTELGGAIGLFGLTCGAPGTVEVSGSSFVGNESRSDGGALWLSGELVSLHDNRFISNAAGGIGGALYSGYRNVDGALLDIGSVRGNRFIGNHADETGGALYLAGAVDEIYRNIFSENTAGLVGGAIHTEGFDSARWRVVRGNVLERNAAGEDGGAIYMTCSNLGRAAVRRIEKANRLIGNRAHGRKQAITEVGVC